MSLIIFMTKNLLNVFRLQFSSCQATGNKVTLQHTAHYNDKPHRTTTVHTARVKRHGDKMDTFEHIIFQLIVHVYSASLNKEPSLVFGKEKGTVAFHFPIRPEGYDTILFYRPLGEDNKLLMTVTGEETISHSERVFYRVSKVTGTFLVTLKSLFDSGTYIAETWREKHLITKHIYCVKICSKYQHISHGIKRYQGNEVYETKDFKIDVSFFDPNLRETLKIYKKVEPQELLVGSLTIGPDVCSQISPGEQMSGMQVLHQGSSVWFSNVSAEQDIGQ